MADVELKKCTKCDILKPFSEFYKDKSHKDNRTSICKICRSKYIRQWYTDNKKSHNESSKQYYENNREHLIEINKLYKKTDDGKKAVKKSNTKRKRNLGFIPINKPFNGCHAHHLNIDTVMYIPAKLHRSIYHSVLNNKNMNKINNLAENWYLKDQGVI